MAKSIAVGNQGRLYMVDNKDRIWYSSPNPRKKSCPGKAARSTRTTRTRRPKKQIKTKKTNNSEELKKEFSRLLNNCNKNDDCRALAYDIFAVKTTDEALRDEVKNVRE